MPDLRDYVPVIIGLLVGAMAHFGLMLASGRTPRMVSVLGYIMQLGLVGLVATVVTASLGWTGDLQSLATAILALSTQEVIEFLKKRGWIAILRAQPVIDFEEDKSSKPK